MIAGEVHFHILHQSQFQELTHKSTRFPDNQASGCLKHVPDAMLTPEQLTTRTQDSQSHQSLEALALVLDIHSETDSYVYSDRASMGPYWI